ncbi:hypothetical protein ABZW30_08195 [Kitasatospora sp. NPDC004669]|uniref:hypothetical protein n=1 Tax=Kitasatospora sp. NPDC004669 TaxID=3154555 RepID=UPI0033B84982
MEDVLFGNPDFELYDNVGRTTEQIQAHRWGHETDYDLLRWGLQDALRHAGRREAPPDSGAAITTWSDLLSGATTVLEAAAVLDHVNDGVDGALPHLHQFLEQAAEHFHQRGDGERADEFDRHALALQAVGDQIADTVENLLSEARRSRRAEAARATGRHNGAATAGPQQSTPPPSTGPVDRPHQPGR